MENVWTDVTCLDMGYDPKFENIMPLQTVCLKDKWKNIGRKKSVAVLPKFIFCTLCTQNNVPHHSIFIHVTLTGAAGTG